MSKSTRAACAAGVAALIVFGAGGCRFVGKEFSDSFTTEAAITEIRVDGGSGDVVVRPGTQGQVDIARTVHYLTGSAPNQTHHVSGSVLELATHCGNDCWVSYEVQVPTSVKVTGNNGSGNLTLTGVSSVDFTLGSGDVTIRDATGPVRISTGSGNIDLNGLTGTVNASTGSGDVDGKVLNVDGAVVSTESGNVTLNLTRVANVQADTGSGDVTVVVPQSDYTVVTDTDSGDVKIRVNNVTAGAHRIQVTTNSGNIDVLPTRT